MNQRQPTRRRHSDSNRKANDPIAIVGIGCRFPGKANGPDSFWNLLTSGTDAVSEIPHDRWNLPAFYNPHAETPGRTYARWGGFLDRIDLFDAGFFGISPREALTMDPQQRQLLEVSLEAMEDAGLQTHRLRGTNVGVFIGISTNDYAQIQSSIDERGGIDTHTTTGSVMSIAANRISYCFDFKGPSIAVDTACSSSLVAVHLACQSIWNAESSLALAGGVNIIICPDPFIGFSKLSMLSREGRCKAFDATGNGFVRAEGVGIVVLKPLKQALNDGDSIYALVNATAVNQDGKTNGITVPSQESQAAMLRKVCEDARLDPRQIDYVEAHGTGTSVGDPIETNAIGEVFGKGRAPKSPCIIGSVKSNIGHLEAGAGIAGLIKVALSLKHGQIPPNLHFDTPNPLIDFRSLRLRVQTKLGPWPRRGGRHYAGVNSFGFGGTNAHVLLSERVSSTKDPAPKSSHRPSLIPITARSKDALTQSVESYRSLLAGSKNGHLPSLDALARALAHRTSHHDHRLTIVARSLGQLKDELDGYVIGENRLGMHQGHMRQSGLDHIAFVFSGQGTQWWGMGRLLLEQEPVFRKTITRCDRIVRSLGGWSLLKELSRSEETSRLNKTAIAQPAIFALQAALFELWKCWGIEPTAVIGHSVGEVAAAYAAGVFTLEQATTVIFHRGRCMDLASSRGRMLGVGLARGEAAALITPYVDRVTVAAVNSPHSVTLSGEEGILIEIQKRLDQQHVFNSLLRIEYAFHSKQMEPVRAELLRSLKGLRPSRASKLMISTVTSSPVRGTELIPSYWWHNVRKPVMFADGVKALIDRGHAVFVEVSAHPALSTSVKECLHEEKTEGIVLPTLRRNDDDYSMMLGSLGGLFAHGVPIDWGKLYPKPRHTLRLPSYPWQHEPYWSECNLSRQSRLAIESHPMLGRRLPTADPTWRSEISIHRYPALRDHRVQDHTVFPAAAYVVLAVAAAREVLGHGPVVLEDVEFLKPLFLSEDGPIPVVQTTLHAESGTFAVHSADGDEQNRWTLHARGRARIDRTSRHSVDLQTIRERCTQHVSREQTYDRFKANGLPFGPCFSLITATRRGTGEALATISSGTTLVSDELSSYKVHPSTLDAVLQGLSETLDIERAGRASIFLPSFIASLYCAEETSHLSLSHATLRKSSPRGIEGDVLGLDPNGNVLLDVRGFVGRPIDTVEDPVRKEMGNWLYEIRWHLKSLEPIAQSSTPWSLPSLDETAPTLLSRSEELASTLGHVNLSKALQPDFDRLCTGYIVNSLKELGWTPQSGDGFTVKNLLDRLGVTPRLQKQLARFLEFLRMDGILTREGDLWTVCKDPGEIPTRELWRDLVHRFPLFQAELLLTARAGKHLSEVLRGEFDPLAVLFPEGSMSTSEHLYQHSPSFRYYNLITAEAVQLFLSALPEGRKLRILEIGGGTAGLTSSVLSGSSGDLIEYTFTDVSPTFLSRAEAKFQQQPSFKVGILDIERDPRGQGFENSSFDLILASDVLHATEDIHVSLRNVKQLLAPRGVLLTIETYNPARWAETVFGLTDGWWRFKDTQLRNSLPLLSRSQWTSLLMDEGFGRPLVLPGLPEEDSTGSQCVFVAQSKSNEFVHHERPALSGRWILCADPSPVSAHIADELRTAGCEVTVITAGDKYGKLDDTSYVVQPQVREDLDSLFADLALSQGKKVEGILHCWGITETLDDEIPSTRMVEAAQSGCISVLNLVQSLSALGMNPVIPVHVITRCAQPVGSDVASLSVSQSPLIGLIRVIQNEHAELRFTSIDLGPGPLESHLPALIMELALSDGEGEVALRGDARYIPRLVRLDPDAVTDPYRSGTQHHGHFRLVSRSPGILDSLSFHRCAERRPGPDEVEIHVEAAALNFRDVMKAMGIYPIDADEESLLGDECSGKVIAMGEHVTGFSIGDEVLAIAPGSMGSHVIQHASFVAKKPGRLRHDESVTIPIVFLTAHYALHHLARIAPGEKVLVHAAAGGVGLAAIQIARTAGAEVLVTAGTIEKRDFLEAYGIRNVFDSRSLSFADDVLKATDGRGVDIVLNSLSGDSIQKGVSCLAPFGRFVEIGKRDVYQNSALGLRQFRNNISFFVVDLAKVMADKPLLFKSMMKEVMHKFEERIYHPLPVRVFPLTSAIAAFRHMSQSKHIGKIVLANDCPKVHTTPPSEPAVTLNEHATYLITGGLGGFGLATAQWLADRGARHLMLMGRHGPISPVASTALEALASRSVDVRVFTGDVSRDEDLHSMLGTIRESMPPLRGIVHAAMVLDDGILIQQTGKRFNRVMTPKVGGAWALHTHTKQDTLDFFVMYSSATTMAGNPGQGNYVAANAFLDALAHHRRMQGLPALTIDWGQISDHGYVARNQAIAEHLTSIGLRGFTANKALATMDLLLQQKAVQAGVMDFDWRKWASFIPVSASRRFSQLLTAKGARDYPETGTSVIRDIILATPAEERHQVVVKFVAENVGRVIGVPATRLQPEQALNELGLDSLMTVELKNRIEKETGISIPAVDLLRGPTIAKLSSLIVESISPVPQRRQEQEIPTASGTIDSSKAEQLLRDIDRLDDSEVRNLLEQLEPEDPSGVPTP